MKNKLAIPLLGLALCILGLTVQIVEKSNPEAIQGILKGKGNWIVIIGLLISSVGLIISGIKKKK